MHTYHVSVQIPVYAYTICSCHGQNSNVVSALQGAMRSCLRLMHRTAFVKPGCKVRKRRAKFAIWLILGEARDWLLHSALLVQVHFQSLAYSQEVSPIQLSRCSVQFGCAVRPCPGHCTARELVDLPSGRPARSSRSLLCSKIRLLLPLFSFESRSHA